MQDVAYIKRFLHYQDFNTFNYFFYKSEILSIKILSISGDILHLFFVILFNELVTQYKNEYHKSNPFNVYITLMNDNRNFSITKLLK